MRSYVVINNIRENMDHGPYGLGILQQIKFIWIDHKLIIVFMIILRFIIFIIRFEQL